MIKVGQRVTFDPTRDLHSQQDHTSARVKATGTVVYVNDRHGWFSVMYDGLRTSFKFTQIGQEVRICK